MFTLFICRINNVCFLLQNLFVYNFCLLFSGPYLLGHSHSFDDAYDHTLKPRGMSGSASTLWQSSGMEDTEVDYISLGEEKNFVKLILI